MISGTNRIVLNTLAAYGRSLITFPLNLIGARWVLGGLGQVDFGICNVVGGMIFFVTFLNAVLSGSVSRYYAYAIGQGQNNSTGKVSDELCRWFNVTLGIHLALPLLLLIGYPVFAYAVRHWLVIPPDRVDAAIWVLRFSMVTAVLGFVNVAYTAMFSAHQWIVELSLYTLLTSILNFIIAMIVPYFDGDRLIFYMGATSAASVSIMIIQNCRVRYLFPEARIVWSQLYVRKRICELMKFVVWRLLSGAAYVARGQGSSILTNIYFGPSVNASYSIGGQLSAQAGGLSQNLINALTPAVTTLEGARDRKKMLDLSFRSCRFAAILVMLFALPLSLEVDEVLILWLKNPPQYSGVVCVCMLAYLFVDKLTIGQYLAVMADGRIGAWQTLVTCAYVMTFLIGWGLILCGSSVYSVAYAYVIVSVIIASGNLYYARKNVGMSIMVWVRTVLLRLAPVVAFSLAAGYLVVISLPMSFVRVLLTGLVCAIVTLGLSWLAVLSVDEKRYVKQMFMTLVLGKFRNHGGR